MNPVAGCFQNGTAGSNDRSLPIGAGYMNNRRQFLFRIAQAVQKPLQAAEREIDFFRMQPGEPLQNPVRFHARIQKKKKLTGSRSFFIMGKKTDKAHQGGF